MSYILDALKRADAERERGHVPGIHTRTAPELDAQANVSGGLAKRGWLMGLGTMLALSVAVLLWWWMATAPPAAPTVSAMAPAAPSPATTTSPALPLPLPLPSPSPAASLTPTQPPESAGSRRSVASESAPPVLPILSPPPPPPPPPTPAKAAASLPTAPAADAQRASGKAASTTATPKNVNVPPASGGVTAATASTAIQSFGELTPEARARLPPVNISGSTYSKNPALRMLIANGKVVQEGGEIAPGLMLETIEPRSAVLNHQGLRYRIGY